MPELQFNLFNSPWATTVLLVLLIALVTALVLKISRRDAFADTSEPDEESPLEKRFAAGLISLDQYRWESKKASRRNPLAH
jgi:hypothetical protein